MHHFDFSGRRILVVGDVMLDRYLTGSIDRLSPEAPVAVLRRQGERAVLGGAANVAANIASLGADVAMVGLIGEDEQADTLLSLLAAFPGVRTDHLLRDQRRPTTCKTRVMSGSHQIVRIDTETTAWPDAEIEAMLLDALEEALSWAEVVVISDYAKGLCSDAIVRAAIERAACADKTSIVDPKRRDFSIYRGATLIKPNRRELGEATGLPCDTDQQVELAAHAAMAVTGSAVLLTRSEHGMSYFASDRQSIHLKTAARDVFDVSGAGDTVIAVAALGAAAKLPVQETMRLANAAAGIVVSKVGTAVVTARELDDVLEMESHQRSPTKGALASLDHAVQQCDEWRTRGLRVGFTNGCFDLLHPGHVTLLKLAAAECDRLVVGINSDTSVRRLKGPSRPVQSEDARAYVLGALTAVDLVVLFEDDTPLRLIEALRPDLLVKGADYKEEEVVGAEFVKTAGGAVLLVPLVANQSTTAMIGRAASR